jgi:acyl dehydratase
MRSTACWTLVSGDSPATHHDVEHDTEVHTVGSTDTRKSSHRASHGGALERTGVDDQQHHMDGALPANERGSNNMAGRVIATVDDFMDLVGLHLGYSDYVEITQEMVDLFAHVTGDHQWIHTDVERARQGPFGGTIAHGYLTLSLGPRLAPEIYDVSAIPMGLNYGCNRVRFPSPVPVGSRVRLGVDVLGVDEVAGGIQITMNYTFEVEGSSKPGCVAEVIVRWFR